MAPQLLGSPTTAVPCTAVNRSFASGSWSPELLNIQLGFQRHDNVTIHHSLRCYYSQFTANVGSFVYALFFPLCKN